MTSNVWNTYWNNDANHNRWDKPAKEVIELINTLSPNEKPRVLDLGCGIGRHAIAFALAGFQVTATDISLVAIDNLIDWAKQLHLSIETKVCNATDDDFQPESYDIVLSYNVIYHGLRFQFKEAIQHVYKLLKNQGIFYFTCPSREDGKYGVGEMIAPHTYKCEKSITPGDIHYFTDENDLDELINDFRLLKRWRNEGYWENNGEQQYYSNWNVQVEKLCGPTRACS